VLDVHADLDDAGASQVEPERTHAREAAAALAHDRRDLTRDVERRITQVHVERDQRPPGTDDHAAGTIIQARRAERGRELPRVEAPLQLLRPAVTEERGAAAWIQLSVEEYRQIEFAADPARGVERTRSRPLHVLACERHDR